VTRPPNASALGQDQQGDRRCGKLVVIFEPWRFTEAFFTIDFGCAEEQRYALALDAPEKPTHGWV